jgi:hypothetical protein
MTDKVHVFNDFLEPEDFKNIQNLLLGNSFPWYYNSTVVGEDEDNDNHFQFTHSFFHGLYQYSTYFDTISPILEMINPISLIRIKSNLLTKTQKNIEHGFHIDLPELKKDHHPTTAIFYVNTNNGYTKFEDGNIVKSVENRLIMFDSRMSHTGASCTDEKTRVVINFNYFSLIRP